MKIYGASLATMLAIIGHTAVAGAQDRSQIPSQFIGTWIEDQKPCPCDQLRIEKDRLIWNRTDEANNGDTILKLDAIRVSSGGENNSVINFSVQNIQKQKMGSFNVVLTSNAPVSIQKIDGKLKLDIVITVSNLAQSQIGSSVSTYWFNQSK
jgi:hypothetical protein